MTDKTIYIYIQGEQGFSGEPGPEGRRGPTGERGIPGPAGVSGGEVSLILLIKRCRNIFNECEKFCPFSSQVSHNRC